MNRTFSILFFIVFQCFTVFSQEFSPLENTNGNHYNIPPRHVLNPKTFVKIDYSNRLQDLKRNFPANKDFLSEFTKQEMLVLKNKYPNDYAYYRDATAYFKLLSKKIKRAFSKKELWYIYQFDSKLKAKLLTIK